MQNPSDSTTVAIAGRSSRGFKDKFPGARFRQLISKSARALQAACVLAIAALPAVAAAQSCSTEFCTIDMNSRIWINNNTWGSSSSPAGWSESITRLGANSFRTDFNWPSGPNNNNVKAYPSAVLGWHWGWHFPTGTGLPTQLSANQNVNTDYNYSVNFGGGVGNVAYDCWLHTQSLPTWEHNPSDEIMIWVNNTGAGPIGGVIATVNIGGANWNLHRGNIGWEVWSFVRVGNSSSGSLNIKNFTDYLRNSWGLSSRKYLTSVQFGTEIFRGTGNLIVNNFTCTVGGGGTTPNFTLSANPSSLTVNRGSSGTSTINISRTSFTSSVALSASGLPSGVTASFNPSSTTGNSSTLTLSASSTAALGSSTVTITGTGGGLTRTTTVNLTVNAGGSQTIANGTYRIIARHSGKALDVSGGGTANGTQVLQWPYNGANNQRWTVTHLGSGQYQIQSVSANKALDVNASGTANGTKIQIWTYGGANNQRWTITPTSGGYYRVSPVHDSGNCLDVSGNSTADGAIVHSWDYLGANNQQWAFQAP